jgi:hypothetical protein
MDFAIARNIRLGGARSLQLRLEMFNAFNNVIITGRNASAQFASLTDRTTITNLPGVDANGNPVRNLPSNAGFGVANAAQDMRSFQVQVRFSF